MSRRASVAGDFLDESRERIDRYLDGVLPAVTEPPVSLHEAMRYAVFSGGRRLRPALAFGASLACGKSPDAVLGVAGAVELVHAYSLVHDDLPAMDDDGVRRGRPTVHVLHGEATAILVGDALLTEAFGLLARTEAPPPVLLALAEAAGSRALVGGQVEDLRFHLESATPERVEWIHARKTGSLFRFAVVGVARALAAEAALVDALERYASQFGSAFQLLDDLTDARSDECSALAVWTEEEVREKVVERVREALRAIEPLGAVADPLRGLVEQLPQRLR